MHGIRETSKLYVDGVEVTHVRYHGEICTITGYAHGQIRIQTPGGKIEEPRSSCVLCCGFWLSDHEQDEAVSLTPPLAARRA